MADLIITCVSTDESFPKVVFNHLLEELQTQMGTKRGHRLEITPQTATLKANEIQLRESSHVPKGLAKKVLESFLKSDPSAYKDYSVIEFGDTFTLGPVLPIDTLSCEFCGYFTQYPEDLYTHRMTHLVGF